MSQMRAKQQRNWIGVHDSLEKIEMGVHDPNDSKGCYIPWRDANFFHFLTR